MNNTWFRLQSF